MTKADILCARLFDAARSGDVSLHSHFVVRADADGIEVQLNHHRSDRHETLTEALDDLRRRYASEIAQNVARGLEHVNANRGTLERLGVANGD